MAERVAGVGALVIRGDGWQDVLSRCFLTVRELCDKRASNKLAGMLSIPMETVEPGEDLTSALGRMFEEEVVIDGLDRDALESRIKLCKCELRPGVALHTFLITPQRKIRIQIGSHPEEVNGASWTMISDVVSSYVRPYEFRPGVYESIQSYIRFLNDPNRFETQFFAYDELRCTVPEGIFDLIDSGFTQKEALSRLGLRL